MIIRCEHIFTMTPDAEPKFPSRPQLKKNLSLTYNRKRQAKITNEIIELSAGAEAV